MQLSLPLYNRALDCKFKQGQLGSFKIAQANYDVQSLTIIPRWTAIMEACNFGHKNVVEALLKMPSIDLEAVNLRGQRAEDVAMSRGHEHLAQLIR